MQKILRINMNTGSVVLEDLTENYTLLGGRGLVAKVLTDEAVNPTCDPLGKENKLVFALGLFAGTGFPTGDHISVGAKSPLTGGIKTVESGGTIGTRLVEHGIKLVIVEGTPKDETMAILCIPAKGEPFLKKADDCANMGAYAVVKKLKKDYSDQVAIACIGPGGERKYPNATIQVTDLATGKPSRTLARGGIGAVMGSKGLKAIVVEEAEEKSKIEYADKDRFTNAKNAFLSAIERNDVTSRLMNKFGTMMEMAVVSKTGGLPYKNFSGGLCPILDDIGANRFHQNINRRDGKAGLACQVDCPVKCSNVYNDKDGNYLTSGFDYETVAMLGANCNISDLDTIARIDRLCNDFGMDAIELGATIGVCMEAGKLEWGDGKQAMALVNEIVESTDLGSILARGTKATGEHFGVKRIPVVKGQSLTGYEPRNTKGTGVGFATSPLGPDRAIGITSGAAGDVSKIARVPMSQKVQIIYAAINNFMCHFAAFPMASTHKHAIAYVAEALNGRYDAGWTIERVVGIGMETIKLEKAFNRTAGFSAKDDRLPQFFYDEPSMMTGAKFDLTDEELAQVLPF